MSDLSNSAPKSTVRITQNHRSVTILKPAEISKVFQNSQVNPSSKIAKIPYSPEALHKEFIRLGKDRRNLTYKLLALLPEIYKQEIFKKHGYTTIYEYAGRLGGLSDYVVDKTLRLQRHLEHKPFLTQAIETVGVHKVDMIARLATPETDRAWADKVENMSKAGLQELSKEARSKGLADENSQFFEGNLFGRKLSGGNPSRDEQSHGEQFFGESSFGKSSFGEPGADPSFCQAAEQKLSIELDPEMQYMFLKIKSKVGKNLSNREVLRQILKAVGNLNSKFESNKDFRTTISGGKSTPEVLPGDRARSEQSERSAISLSTPQVATPMPRSATSPPKVSRYIPIQQKRATLSQTNHHCAYPNCSHPPEIFHHVKRFALGKNHDSIIPLCKIHHEFAHNGVIEEETQLPQNWRFKISSLDLEESQTARIDSLYRKFRNSN